MTVAGIEHNHATVAYKFPDDTNIAAGDLNGRTRRRDVLGGNQRLTRSWALCRIYQQHQRSTALLPGRRSLHHRQGKLDRHIDGVDNPFAFINARVDVQAIAVRDALQVASIRAYGTDPLPTANSHTRAHESGIAPSMGTLGDCLDNALMEAFRARMQVELLDRRRWRTRIEFANAIFEYLEIFHNRQRRHTALDMLTPRCCHPPCQGAVDV